MSTTFAAQGSVVTPTSGASRRVAITGVSNVTPISVTAPSHGFLATDTVEISATGISALDGNLFQVQLVDANHFLLLGTTASGTSSTGYAVDYELQPAIVLPSGGELADPNVIGAALEGVANPAPFLYRCSGQSRLANLFLWRNGNYSTTPYWSNPWSSNTSFTSTSFTPLASSTMTLQSISPTPSIDSQILPTDILVVSTTFTIRTTNGTSVGTGTYFDVGIQFFQQVIGSPFIPTFVEIVTEPNVRGDSIYPVTLNCAFAGSHFASPYNTVELALVARVDDIAGSPGTFDLYTIGPWSGTILHYRSN